MEPIAIVKLAVVGSIVLLVLSIGLSTRVADTLAFLRAPGPAARAMLAMFVALPLVVIGIGLALPLERATLVTLLAIAVSPMPPVYPGKAGKLGGGDRYVMSLFVLASLVTLVAAPLILWLDSRLLGIAIPFDTAAVLKTLSITILGPLVVGLAVSEFAPTLAARLQRPISLFGTILLGVSVLAVLVVALPAMRDAVGSFTLVAIALLVTAGLAIGHMLGGPQPGNRAALATATALRHPGVVLPLAMTASPADSRQIAGTVLLYLLVATLLGIPYAKWFGPKPN